MRWIRLLSLLAFVAACAGPTQHSIEQDIEQGDVASATEKLEQRRNAYPDDMNVRLQLADAYYQLARKSLDGGDEPGYVRFLSQAQAETLAAMEIEPTSPRPHTWLGIITAYQGEMNAAETAFKNALRLNLKERYELRGGTFYTNVAHISVYQGKLADARRYLDKGIKSGAPQSEVDRIQTLAAWKANDMVEARDIFNGAVQYSPEYAKTWDGAPLPQEMKTFDDFARTCCSNPTCGPYMEGACKRSKQPVARRDLTLETVAAERQLEVERQKKLREIYRRQKEIEIEIEEDGPAPTGPAPAPAPAKK
jgi:tetratricopeptide (TPR) repeat protein